MLPLSMRILMVCLGNICRSPLADGVLRKKCASLKLNWAIDSAGTANYHIGAPPDKRMIQTALKFGVDISMLRARQFVTADFDNFDYICVMDQNNYKNVIQLASNNQEKEKVIFLLDALYPNEQSEVPDPYYGKQADFDYVFSLVDKATDALINHLLHEKK